MITKEFIQSNIDKPIQESIQLLNENGFITLDSCAGFSYPGHQKKDKGHGEWASVRKTAYITCIYDERFKEMLQPHLSHRPFGLNWSYYLPESEPVKNGSIIAYEPFVAIHFFYNRKPYEVIENFNKILRSIS